MTSNELRICQNQLHKLLSDRKASGNDYADLAAKVGVWCDSDPEVMANRIHQALQTASMINMAETAARSYWIALVASLIALLSAAAAWVAVFVQIVGNMKQLYL
jgi:hypothetical protein